MSYIFGHHVINGYIDGWVGIEGAEPLMAFINFHWYGEIAIVWLGISISQQKWHDSLTYKAIEGVRVERFEEKF